MRITYTIFRGFTGIELAHLRPQGRPPQHLIKQFCYESCIRRIIRLQGYFNALCNSKELKNYIFTNCWFI
jgi:hypothetical protein